MSDAADPVDLRARIETARALLAEHDSQAVLTPRLADPLPDLIAQCHGRAAPETEPVRSLHHFACSGGTLIARHLGLQPNTVLLSEIEPLRRPLGDRHKQPFAPTDLIRHLRYSPREIPDSVIEEVFLAALAPLMEHCRSNGRRLVLRDHAHSHFCQGEAVHEYPTLRALLLRRYPVRSVVTVRHPLDSLLSLQHNGWVHFQPPTVDEYARRYMAFLDAYEGVEIFRYEDFTADPEAQLRAICAVLDLPCVGVQEDLTLLLPLTGESGRRGPRILPRARREVSDELARECEQSRHFGALCLRLGY
ncbi:sulfotransferase [Rhodobacteraceae bacterium F11138]|nr:sulfotransferase [Rhodobacteraceae bacterium F11138]